MSFAYIMEVKHHGELIRFRCGLISREDMGMFVWLFESWLKCINDHAPQVIIID